MLDRNDPADYERTLIARVALINCLARDLRVIEARGEWARSEGASRCVSTILLARQDAIAGLAWERERPSVERLLTSDLPCSAPWLPSWLADQALLVAYGAVTGQRIGVKFMQDFSTEKGPRRRVKGDGSSLARDVEWLYRARIKQPTDTVSSLSREYADGDKARGKTARRVVQDAIVRAAVILELTWKTVA